MTGIQRTIGLGVLLWGAATGSARGEADVLALRPPNAFEAYGYEAETYRLPEGPHLFIDWRYVEPGRVAWQTPDGRDASIFGEGDIDEVVAVNQRLPQGVYLAAQPAEKFGPVIRRDRPWESLFSCSTLIHDGDVYRLWYEVQPPPRQDTVTEGETPFYTYFICYAESKDGLHWEKPELGIYEFEGSTANNIVFGGRLTPHGINGTSVFLDPSAPPEERYKLIYTSKVDGSTLDTFLEESPEQVTPAGVRRESAVRGAVSADGLHWRAIERPLFIHLSDTQTIVYYDVALERYVGYFRMFVLGRRAICRAETDEFRRWPVPEVVLWSDPSGDPSTDYYLNGKALYPGTSTMHLMFVTDYERRYDSQSVRLAASLTGGLWQWVPGDYAIEPGPHGAWDAGLVGAGCGLAELPDGRVALPFTGYHLPHKFPRWVPVGQVGLALWGKERLSALCADGEGEFYTIPFVPPGRKLFLNFETEGAGWVRVEVVGRDGYTLDRCDRLTGDQLKAPVTWQGMDEVPTGKDGAVVLRFRLNAAKLFSFEFR